MGKKSAPEADPRIGEAALLSAKTGQDYLKLMKKQGAITNAWAADDRARQQDVFIPLQDEYIADAAAWDSPERTRAAMGAAGATVRNQMDAAQKTTNRQMAAMGVNPGSGRSIETTRRGNNTTALAVAGARNAARDAVRNEGLKVRASAVNLGQGLEVNPGTSMGISNNAYGNGFTGAMQGYGQQGDLLNTQYQQRMQSWQAEQEAGASFWGGAGSLAGAFMSDEDVKENKKPMKKSPRRSIDEMRVEQWDYKEGAGDGKTHVGTYAQDFKKATGMGDGRSIDVIDAIGVTMGATKELSAEVDRLTKQVSKLAGKAPAARASSGRSI